MDSIKIGLDFGTHQTKICVKRTPDEGHGEPNYEFFKFKDLEDNSHYFLPSVIQINDDDTLSYGFVDKKRLKAEMKEPTRQEVELEGEFDVEMEAERLFSQYGTSDNSINDIKVLSDMLTIRLSNIKRRNKEKRHEVEKIYNEERKRYIDSKNVFRYFKQSYFIGGYWEQSRKYSARLLCIWYLAYVIFLLEEQFGTEFSINMGVPTDDEKYAKMQQLAVEILASAYYLVEDVYENDMKSFLNEKIEDLISKTDQKKYSDNLKDEYYINVFPEAYASLIALSSQGRITPGMCLTADIGGGTTDISFFTVQKEGLKIYKFWSIPHGLNSIAKYSGFEYQEGNFENRIKHNVIGLFNQKKHDVVDKLVKDLIKRIQKTGVPVKNLMDKLNGRVLVYAGGGSTFHELTSPIYLFTDVNLVDDSIWREQNVKEIRKVANLSPLLSTAFGLTQSENDDDVKLKSYDTLLEFFPDGERSEKQEISKDVC